MNIAKAEIIAQLKKDILPLQGFKTILGAAARDVVPIAIRNAFARSEFPLGTVHEFIDTCPEDAAATGGFVSGILSSLLGTGGACIWISKSPTIFPPALQSFGISPDKIIFIHPKKDKEMLWVMEEALRCGGLAAVVGEIQSLNFTASRRLQLAVEESGVTGFIMRHDLRVLNTTACVTRWKVTCLSSEIMNGMPGVGFPLWKVELLKVRNGRPGIWEIEFTDGRFRHVSKITAIPFEHKRKTG